MSRRGQERSACFLRPICSRTGLKALPEVQIVSVSQQCRNCDWMCLLDRAHLNKKCNGPTGPVQQKTLER